MKIALSTAVIGVVFLSACQPPATSEPMEPVAAPAAMSMTEQVATATCSDSIPERDDWLRSERPAVANVVSSYQSRGINPEDSGVFRAYRAYMNAGQNHDVAAASIGGDYARLAACFS